MTLTTWTTGTICTTWTTMTSGTTLTTLTDQGFIKKIIAEFALFTWSCFHFTCQERQISSSIRRRTF